MTLRPGGASVPSVDAEMAPAPGGDFLGSLFLEEPIIQEEHRDIIPEEHRDDISDEDFNPVTDPVTDPVADLPEDERRELRK